MPQTVKTPRIYINVPEYLATTGEDIDPLFRTLPFSATSVAGEVAIPTMSGLTYTNPYIAFLGHNFSNHINLMSGAITPIINGQSGSFDNGFSIMETETNSNSFQFDLESSISSVVTGTYYDFRSPDLNLTLEYSYEGVKETTTLGGATLTNQFYNKPPYDWELGANVGNKYRKSGRRIWQMQFSYLDSDSVFPTNSALDNNDEPLTTTDTLLDSNSIQRLIHLLNGGQNSFIFCSDSTNPTADNHAICKLDQNTFQFKQVAFNTYNVKMTFKEIW